ncbi:MAG: oligosaccharide flippase family protein [Rhodomicrobium sp.]
MTPGKLFLGTIAIASASALRLAAQVLVMPIVARLIGPNNYGLAVLAGTVLALVIRFGDIGFAATIVRARSSSRDLDSTVFWIAIAITSALAALLAMAAYPLGRLLGHPEVSPLLLCISPLPIVIGVAMVPAALLQRDGKFKAAAACEIISAFVGIAVVIYGSLNGWGAWALIAQQFGFWASKLAIIEFLTRFLPAPVLRLSLIASSLRFNARLWSANIIGFFAGNLDNLVIATFLNSASLGYYALAYQIISIPNSILGASHYSLFPAFAETRRLGRPAEATYASAIRLILLITAPAIVGLVVVAAPLVTLMLGESWKPTAMLIRLLAPAGLLMPIFVLNSALFLGFDRADLELRVQVLKSGLVLAAIIGGLALGVEGVAGGVSIGFGVAFAVCMHWAMRTGGISFSALAEAVQAPLAASATLALGISAVRVTCFQGLNPVSDLVLSVIAGCVIYLSALYLGFRSQFLDDIFQVRLLLKAKIKTS